MCTTKKNEKYMVLFVGDGKRTADMYVCAPQKKNKHADIYVCVPQNKKEQYMVLLVGDREGTDRGIEVKAISGVSESDLPALYTG
jgi:uncharacterized protein YpmB